MRKACLYAFAGILLLAPATGYGCTYNSMTYTGYTDMGNCVFRLNFDICIDESNGKTANTGWLIELNGGTIVNALPNPLVNNNNGGNVSFTPVINGTTVEWGCLSCMGNGGGSPFIPILGNTECFTASIDVMGNPGGWTGYGNLIGPSAGCVVGAAGSCNHPNCVFTQTTNGVCTCSMCDNTLNNGCDKDGFEYCCDNGTLPSFPSCCQLTTTTSTTDIMCAGDNDGTGTVTITTGTAPFTYIWSNGQTGQTATGLAPGSYTVTVSSSDGCEDIQTVTIVEPPPLSISTSHTDPLCAGDGDGTASTSVGGGTPGYTYVWSNGGNGTSITGLGPGTYTVTATDANGCTSTSSVTVTEPPPLTISTSPDLNVCSDDTPTSDLTATPGGGTPGYTYNWSNGGTTGTITVTNNLNTNITYTVTITDANGCIITDQVVVNVSCTPLVTLSDTLFCNGGCATIREDASGGAPPYTYQWDDPSLTGPGPHQVCPAATTQYCLTITDVNGETANGCMTVTVNDPPALSTSGTDAVCGQCDGSVAVVATGNGPFTYLWDNGCTSATCGSQCPGTYQVTVTDGNGCINQTNETIGNIGGPAITASATDALCAGACDGSVALTISTQSTPPYTYLWNSGCTSVTCTNICAGSYTVTITDANGCTSTGSATVNEPTPVMLTSSSTDETCNNCQGSASVNASGGTPGYTYNWSTGATTPGITNLCAGNYNVTVTDTHGCTSISSATVNNNDIGPNADFIADPTIVTILNPVINFTDKSLDAITWLWDFGDSSSSTAANPLHTFADTGCYLVTLMIENQYGCRDTVERTVCVRDISSIYVPNAFSPNGDGFNEWFTVGHYNYCEIEMYVFDRWGNLIYQTSSFKGWDGTANGGSETAQEDVYVWLIRAVDCYGEVWRRIGHVTLVR